MVTFVKYMVLDVGSHYYILDIAVYFSIIANTKIPRH